MNQEQTQQTPQTALLHRITIITQEAPLKSYTDSARSLIMRLDSPTILLAIFTLLTTVLASSVSVSNDVSRSKPFLLRVIPLGASITVGYRSSDGNGYRKFLRDQMRYAGWGVDMVGSLENGTMKDNVLNQYQGITVDAKFLAKRRPLWRYNRPCRRGCKGLDGSPAESHSHQVFLPVTYVTSEADVLVSARTTPCKTSTSPAPTPASTTSSTSSSPPSQTQPLSCPPSSPTNRSSASSSVSARNTAPLLPAAAQTATASSLLR